MKKYILLFTIASIVLINACTKRHKQDKLHYYQDFESVKGWTSLLVTDEVSAHSGIYSTSTSKEYPYSNTLQLAPKDLEGKQIKKVKLSVWCNLKSLACEGGLCLQIVNAANENKLWVSTNLKDIIKTEGKWTKVSAYADLSADLLDPQNTIKIFVWNIASEKIYIDDFEVEFAE